MDDSFTSFTKSGEGFTVVLEDCVGTGRAFGGGVVYPTVRAGEPLDPTVLRSYCTGAAHMALSWVTSESLSVDDSGEVHDLTIRSFGVLRSDEVPHVDVTIAEEETEPVAVSDAVFAAVLEQEGVALDLENREEVIDAYQAIIRNARAYSPDAVIDGVEVAEMVVVLPRPVGRNEQRPVAVLAEDELAETAAQLDPGLVVAEADFFSVGRIVFQLDAEAHGQAVVQLFGTDHGQNQQENDRRVSKYSASFLL